MVNPMMIGQKDKKKNKRKAAGRSEYPNWYNRNQDNKTKKKKKSTQKQVPK